MATREPSKTSNDRAGEIPPLLSFRTAAQRKVAMLRLHGGHWETGKLEVSDNHDDSDSPALAISTEFNPFHP